MKAQQTSNNIPTFIEALASELASFRNDNNYADYTVVVPTRRAALIFKLTFAQLLKREALLPSVYSISDFIVHHTPQRIVEKKELLLEFYTLYKKYFKDIDFRSYAPWGEMILSDFDEVNRYLIDHTILFADLKSYKDIETLFQDDEEQLKQLQNFYNLFSAGELSKLKHKFSEIWIKLPLLYENLFAQLRTSHKTTEGYALREMALSPEIVLSGLNTSTTILAGFYALTPAEKNIFEYIQQGEGLIRWDADNYYVDSVDQEAGLFFRKNSLTQKEFRHKTRFFSTTEKDIKITGVPLVTGQVKYLGERLQSLVLDKKINPDKTAIVLPDESLLPQVLQSIPKEIEDLNITMGYPFSNTNLFRFINFLEELKTTSVITDKQILYHHQSFKQLIRHPYATIFKEWLIDSKAFHGFHFSSEELQDEAKSFLAFWMSEENPFEKHLFVYNKTAAHLESIQSSEKDIAAFMLNELEELKALANPYMNVLDRLAQEMLIDELYKTTRIPFSGEPVKGLQIMGLLETRVLDFENIFILNVNEGSLPKISKHHSFIPFSLRKSFNLPTYTEQDAISAYHFWRLMQRAHIIELIYNTKTDDYAGGERSRYLLQLFYEIKAKLSNWHISHHIITSPLNKVNYVNPEITRTDTLTKELVRISTSGELKFSATSLQTFINCSLQFYFKYIKKIKEPDDIDEEIDSATLGKILHQTVQNLYHTAINKPFSKELAAAMKKHIEQEVVSSIRQIYDKNYKRKGYIYIVEKIIVKYIELIIDSDLKLSEFEVVETETTHEAKLMLKDNVSVIIKGQFDRVDKIENGFRITDYKTGQAEIENIKAVSDVFTDTKYKINLQLMLYLWLAKHSNSKYEGKITAGIYPLRNINSGMDVINSQDWEKMEGEFNSNLIDLIEQIIFESDFTQTEKISHCKFCPYIEICNR